MAVSWLFDTERNVQHDAPEFPNDNPDLWIVRPPPASFVPLLAAPSPEEEVVEVVEFEDSDFTGIEIESIPAPAPPDPFQTFVRTLIEVALAAGAPASIDALVTANLLARGEAGMVTRSESLLTTAQAWRATLRGEDADLSACTTMLDEWSASLIAELAGIPSQREAVRRDLRARGVAAFGMAA